MKIDKSKLQTSDWLTRGLSQEELDREREEAIQSAEEELKKLNMLKPCPFCGKRAAKILYTRTYSNGSRRIGAAWLIQCTDYLGGCSATVYGNTEKEAIKKWNNRSEEEKE